MGVYDILHEQSKFRSRGTECHHTSLSFERASCGLCEFAFADGEAVVAVFENFDISHEFQYRHVSKQKDGDFRRHKCWGAHKRHVRPALIHPGCYRYRTYRLTWNLFNTTFHLAEPSLEQQRRRNYRTQLALARKLPQLKFFRPKSPESGPSSPELPAEIWIMISGYLTRECAAITAQERVGECALGLKVTKLDLTKPLYVAFIDIDGHWYVRSVGHRPRALSRELGGYARDAWPKVLFVVEDHIGIRELRILTKVREEGWCLGRPKVFGAWGKFVCAHDPTSSIMVTSDGLKLRDVSNAEENDRISRLTWRAPETRSADMTSIYMRDRNSGSEGMRMSFFDCNGPGEIDGYSAVSDGTQAVDIMTHRRGDEARKSFYDDDGLTARLWMHMPMNEGEHVTELFARGREGEPAGNFGLTFTTNRGRSIMFGPCWRTGFDTVVKVGLKGRARRVHFNEYNSLQCGMSVLTVEDVSEVNSYDPHSSSWRAPAVPQLPQEGACEAWQYTTCSMHGVAGIRLCVARSPEPRAILGMLLRYEDGSHECVGQFRHDWATETIVMYDRAKLYTQGKRSVEGRCYVAEVTTEAPSDGGEGWLEIPQHGSLVWWFTPEHSIVSYGWDRTPPELSLQGQICES